MANEKISYNNGWIGRVGADAGEGMGCLDLWVGKEGLQVRSLPTGDEVGEMNMNGHFASPSGIPYALGDGILGEDGVLFVRASFWRYQLDAIKKLNPTHPMRLRIYGKFTVDTYPRQDGTTGKSVKCNVQKFDVSWRKENGTAAPTAPTEDAASVQDSAPTVNVPF